MVGYLAPIYHEYNSKNGQWARTDVEFLSNEESTKEELKAAPRDIQNSESSSMQALDHLKCSIYTHKCPWNWKMEFVVSNNDNNPREFQRLKGLEVIYDKGKLQMKTKRILQELMRPCWMRYFGFIIFNNDAEGNSKIFRPTNPKTNDLCMTVEQICVIKAAEFNNQWSFDFMIMNGAKKDRNTSLCAIKGDNGVIINNA